MNQCEFIFQKLNFHIFNIFYTGHGLPNIVSLMSWVMYHYWLRAMLSKKKKKG